jgi:phage tail tape-measure protein
MPNSPKSIEEKYERFINAWRTLAPDKSYGGMTLAEFEAICEPSRTARRNIKALTDQLTKEKANRDHSDDVVEDRMKRVVAGVIADPDEGPDSALIEAFGQVRSSLRKSGLHRGKQDKGAK